MAATEEGCAGVAGEHWGQLLGLPMGLCHKQTPGPHRVVPRRVPLPSLVKGRWLLGRIWECTWLCVLPQLCRSLLLTHHPAPKGSPAWGQSSHPKDKAGLGPWS